MKIKQNLYSAASAILVALILFLIGCGQDSVPVDQAAIQRGEALVQRNSIDDFLPAGTHEATFYTWPIRELGKGSVSVKRDAGVIIVGVKNHRGKVDEFKLVDDLSRCEFEGVFLHPDQAAFERSDGGALGSRVDRVWKDNRLTVLVGRSLSDNKNVIYLNDRLTNDILVISKFPSTPE